MNPFVYIGYPLLMIVFFIIDWSKLKSHTKIERGICIGLYLLSLGMFVFSALMLI